MSAPVLVCFAVSQEAKPFQKLIRTRRDVAVVITGMGARQAERSIRSALGQFSPRLVLTCGFAGALDPKMRIGDVLYEGAAIPDPLLAKLRSAGTRPAKFFCAERVATTAREKSELHTRTGADAVEMESRIIGAVCLAQGLTCVTLRAISDVAGEDLPLDFNALMTPEENLSFSRLAWSIVKAPQKIPALMRLGRHSAQAAGQLARVLNAVV